MRNRLGRRRAVSLLAAAVTGGAWTKRASAAPTTALLRRPGWTTRRLIASPHATQAAAADARYAYAISNTTVAVHDRCTGRIIATGTAAGVTHLNSGYLHGGRIFCAHSNYPATPPESDIRVFDPATGVLDLFHRFVEPPGSLVWCVRREEAWWCCFAWYGAENGRTVLVEYAPGGFGREARRYSFPGEVVADWDGMSASGGLWQGDGLIVSHHHCPVLYELRLPDRGDTLALTGARHCPFPGQGIAADPVGGGLVGIDRGQRRIVFAGAE